MSEAYQYQLQPGTSLKGRFKILRAVKFGAFGDIYLAQDLGSQKKNKCAVKQFKPKNTAPSALKVADRWFQREIQILNNLPTHPQIPFFIDAFEESGERYLVYEWVPGKDLKQEIEDRSKWSENRVIQLLLDGLEILKFIHTQYPPIYHRDIKPENLIVRQHDGKIVAIDFGSAKIHEDIVLNNEEQTEERQHTSIYTSGYTPRDQWDFMHASHDIYALGMTAITVLTGKPARQLKDSRTRIIQWHHLAPQVQPQLVEILDKMVHPDYHQRYQSVGEVTYVLQDLKNRLQPENHPSLPSKPEEHLSTLPRQFSFKYKLISICAVITIPILFWLVPVLQLAYYSHQCQTQLDAEKPEAALPNCRKVTELKPELAQNWNHLGMAYYESEQSDNALSAYEEAQNLEPKNTIALVGKGKTLFELGRYNESEQLFDIATTSKPKSALEWRSQGDAFFVQMEYDRAFNSYQKAIELEPKNSKFWRALGKVKYTLNRNQDSLEAYNKAIELDRGNSEAWNGKGIALIGLGDNQAALEAFQQAAKIDPNDPQSFTNQGLAQKNLGRSNLEREAYQTALSIYDGELKSQPNNWNILAKKADVLSKLSNFEGARVVLDRSLEIKPNYYPTLNLRATVHFQLREFEKALEDIDAALQFAPKSRRIEVLITKGSFLGITNNLPEAVDVYSQAIAEMPDSVLSLQSRGIAYQKLGQVQEALKDFDRVIDLNDTRSSTWVLRGSVLADMGRTEEALASIEKGIKLNPNDSTAWFQKGKILEQLGQNQKAIESYEKALEINPAFPDALKQLTELKEK